MTTYHAALPMYDLPELRPVTDALWQSILAGMHKRGAEPVVDFLRPSTNEENDVILRNPYLLLSQTCWGPISCGITPDLHILAQPDFSNHLGGIGPLYRSAIIATGHGPNLIPNKSGEASLPLVAMNGKRLAFNDRMSLSGYLGIISDVNAKTGERKAFYSEGLHSGSHRRSVAMVAKGDADIAAIDCKTWNFVQRYDKAAKFVHVIGWTQAREGLPYVCSPTLDSKLKKLLTATLLELGAFPTNRSYNHKL